MNVLDNVAFGLRMRRYPSRARARAAEAIGLVQLAGLENRKARPSQWSAAAEQRPARALVQQTQRCCSSKRAAQGLDLKLAGECRARAQGAQSELGVKLTVFVTHDPKEALTMSDRIAVMHDGSCSRSALPEEIYGIYPTGSSPTSSARPTCLRARSEMQQRSASPAARVAASSDHSVGGAKGGARPPTRRAQLGARGTPSTVQVDGVVGRMTYLGNAQVYGEARLDGGWSNGEPAWRRLYASAEVTVSWDPQRSRWSPAVMQSGGASGRRATPSSKPLLATGAPSGALYAHSLRTSTWSSSLRSVPDRRRLLLRHPDSHRWGRGSAGGIWTATSGSARRLSRRARAVGRSQSSPRLICLVIAYPFAYFITAKSADCNVMALVLIRSGPISWSVTMRGA